MAFGGEKALWEINRPGLWAAEGTGEMNRDGNFWVLQQISKK